MNNRVAQCTRVVRDLTTTGTLRDHEWTVLQTDLKRLDKHLADLLVHPRIAWSVLWRTESPATGATFAYAAGLIKSVATKARQRLRLAEKTAGVTCGWAKRDVEGLRGAIAAFIAMRPPGRRPPPPPPGSGPRAEDPRSSEYWEQRFRGRLNGHTPPRADIEEVIAAGFHALAKKRHPDAGGSTEAMQRLNEVVAYLRKRNP